MDENRYPLLAPLIGALLVLVVLGFLWMTETISLQKEFFGLALLVTPIAGFTFVSLLQRWARAAEYPVIPQTDSPPCRFRFGLRTLFLVLVLVSIPCAWVGYSLNWIRQRRDFRNEPRVAAYWHGYDLGDKTKTAPAWLRLFGEVGFRNIWLPPEDLERARRLYPEAEVKVSSVSPD